MCYTPREISLTLSAFRAREHQKSQDQWFLGKMMALAFHAPDRLPSCPPPVPPSREMRADEMKKRLLAWRRKDENR
ncbi:MAG: hypothetical protein E7329_08190 [Clostridiales bacterium]|nr:hypothetical protein [Clostridiales bacterium]